MKFQKIKCTTVSKKKKAKCNYILQKIGNAFAPKIGSRCWRKVINKKTEIFCFLIRSLNIVNILIFLKLILYKSMIPKQTSQRLFKKLKSIIKCVWSSKRAGPPKTILKKKNKIREYTTRDLPWSCFSPVLT